MFLRVLNDLRGFKSLNELKISVPRTELLEKKGGRTTPP